MRNTLRTVALAAPLSLLPSLSSAQTAPITAATTPLEAPPPPPAPSASGQPAAVTADFGRGVTFRTEDRRFSLNIRGRIQARLTVSEQPERPQTEYQIRRMRLVFQGNFFGDDFRYYIQLAFSNLDTEPDLRLPLRDAFVTWQGVRDLNVRFGQMKVPYGRQRVVSSSALQFADRSLGVGEFNLDRDVGVVVFSRDLFGLGRRLTYDLGVFGGDGRNRLSEDFGMLYAARVQVQPFGEFDDLAEADTLRLAHPRLALAVSAAYNQRSRRARSTFGDTYRQPFDQYHLGADLQFKWRGLSIQAEALYRQADDDGHFLGNDTMGRPLFEYSRSGLGYYLQVGYFLNAHAEVAARWGEVIPNDGAAAVLHRARELGGALSWYFQRHDFKLQADYFYLAPEDFSAGRHQARLQAQVFF
jgi:hypothetical protein